MSRRAIRLSCIHALNWYGYQDSLPVEGNLVLAGVTGSGKSILMDLVMLVLVGPEKARHHFNRSATGSQSDRTLKSYCLLDTKREENGQPQYYRDKGGTTYVALEFAWPDGERVETWGLRIEFRSASENEGLIKPFFCKGKLEREHFLEASPDDGKKRPRDLSSFASLIEARDGRIFPTSREYTRDMANITHLNFNRDVLDRLLPSAMSFTNLKSFDDFCRRFVLPSEVLAVEDLTASYRDFLSYKSELTQLINQHEKLKSIHTLSEKLKSAERDRDVARYLAAELFFEHSSVLVSSAEKKLSGLREAHAIDDAKLKELEQQIKRGNDELDRLKVLLHETPEGRLYDLLTQQVREQEERVTELRGLSQRVEERLLHRVGNAKLWLGQVLSITAKSKLDTHDVERAIHSLESCETSATYTALASLRDTADRLCQALRQSISAETKELSALRQQHEELSRQITVLKHGLPPIAQPLLHAINDSLPRLPGQPLAQALRELCEVSDETWRGALEVAFTDKFAIVVAEEHFSEALTVYHELKPAMQTRDAAPELLLHPARVGTLTQEVLPNSLAGMIETNHPVARAFVDHFFGHLICFTSLRDFKRHDGDGILPDGLTMRGAIIKRANHYDGIPYIGKRGLKKQLEIKTSSLRDIEAGIRRLEPIEKAVEQVISSLNKHIPEHASMSKDLHNLENLPALEAKLSASKQRLSAIDSAELESISQQVNEWQTRIKSWDHARFEIATQSKQNEIKQLQSTLETRIVEKSKCEDEFTQVKIRLDISLHLERLQTWRTEMRNAFLVPDAMAREFEKALVKANEAALSAIGDLKQSMTQFKSEFHPRFDDLPEDGRNVAPYEKVLHRIAEANIPEYEAKAEMEKKRWESLFRTQVLSRMQAALKRVEDIIFLLNQQLKRPIGRDRYKIERRPNPEFKMYRDLIDLNAVRDQDDLFFASVSGELRDALDNFLGTLVNKANSPEAVRLLDYRQYYDYKLFSSDVNDLEASPIDVDRQSGKMSGGENQSPYFVAILASYLHAYNRHEKRWKEPSLALVPIDEAFSKLSGERIQDCINAVGELDLQGVFSMSSGNIPYAFSLCDELIVITKREERRAGKILLRNIPSILRRDTPEGRNWMQNHGE